jgi:hypothetical protein
VERESVLAAVADLPDRYRDIVNLRYPSLTELKEYRND